MEALKPFSGVCTYHTCNASRKGERLIMLYAYVLRNIQNTCFFIPVTRNTLLFLSNIFSASSTLIQPVIAKGFWDFLRAFHDSYSLFCSKMLLSFPHTLRCTPQNLMNAYLQHCIWSGAGISVLTVGLEHRTAFRRRFMFCVSCAWPKLVYGRCRRGRETHLWWTDCGTTFWVQRQVTEN